MTAGDARVERVDVTALRVPTDAPEADGTLAWDATTMVLVRLRAAGIEGLGYTYGAPAAAAVVDDMLADVVRSLPPTETPRAWMAMRRRVRNVGSRGVAASAVAAVDAALWDLKARLLGVAVADLLGRCRDGVAVYGSGGFTSYDDAQLEAQLAGWADAGIGAVKMKVGSRPQADERRVARARAAIGAEVALMVDANGAYDRKQALAMAEAFARHGVTWFEEPVSSDDLEGLRLLRDRGPAGMAIAAGEYGFDVGDLRRMIEAGAVDVLQPDATRCLGPTGFVLAAALCEAHGLPLSAHTAPSLHAHLCCHATTARHVEWFHDHVRIEAMLFDGALAPERGRLVPDAARPGFGLSVREDVLARYAR
jgi:L-alanine-DL-glutamate epimerase-like enolase superfamily enzyme